MKLGNYQFTFKTNADLAAAEATGHVPDYDIVRMEVEYPDRIVDYPVKSEEEYLKEMREVPERGGKIIQVYPDKHYYDIMDYADEFKDGGVVSDGQINFISEVGNEIVKVQESPQKATRLILTTNKGVSVYEWMPKDRFKDIFYNPKGDSDDDINQRWKRTENITPIPYHTIFDNDNYKVIYVHSRGYLIYVHGIAKYYLFMPEGKAKVNGGVLNLKRIFERRGIYVEYNLNMLNGELQKVGYLKDGGSIESAKKYTTEYGHEVEGFVSTSEKAIGKYAGLPIVFGVEKNEMRSGPALFMVVGGILKDGILVNVSEAMDDWFGDKEGALNAARKMAGNEPEATKPSKETLESTLETLRELVSEDSSELNTITLQTVEELYDEYYGKSAVSATAVDERKMKTVEPAMLLAEYNELYPNEAPKPNQVASTITSFENWLNRYAEKPDEALSVAPRSYENKMTRALFKTLGIKMPRTKPEMIKALAENGKKTTPAKPSGIMLDDDKYDLRIRMGSDYITTIRDFFVKMGGKVEKDKFDNFINGLNADAKRQYQKAWKEYREMGFIEEVDGSYINTVLYDGSSAQATPATQVATANIVPISVSEERITYYHKQLGDFFFGARITIDKTLDGFQLATSTNDFEGAKLYYSALQRNFDVQASIKNFQTLRQLPEVLSMLASLGFQKVEDAITWETRFYSRIGDEPSPYLHPIFVVSSETYFDAVSGGYSSPSRDASSFQKIYDLTICSLDNYMQANTMRETVCNLDGRFTGQKNMVWDSVNGKFENMFLERLGLLKKPNDIVSWRTWPSMVNVKEVVSKTPFSFSGITFL